MKKILLMAAVALAGLTACQTATTDSHTKTVETQNITLRQAFDQLSKVQSVAITAPDYNLPVVADVISDAKLAAAYNLDAGNIKVSADEAFDVLNNVSLTKLINGGSNGEVAAFVYAEPNDRGTNDVLIAAMSGYRGSLVFMYGEVDNAAKEAIQSAPFNIEGNYLNLETALPDGNEFRITLSKAR